MRVLVLNGPNLGRLGRRQPEIYGSTTFDELADLCVQWGGELGQEVEVRQTNHEGELLDWLNQAADDGRLTLSHVGQKFPVGALGAFVRNPSEHYRWNPMPSFGLTDDEAIALEAHLTKDAWRPDLPALPKDPAIHARGRQLVETSGCLACHELKGAKNRMPLVDLTKPRAADGKSCAQGRGPADYGLLEEESKALTAFVAGGIAPALLHTATTRLFSR